MSDKDMWTVEVKGPKGVRIVEVTGESVERYVGIDSYTRAAWLAGWALHKAATDAS